MELVFEILVREDGRESFLGEDSTVLRAFMEDEIRLFLKITGFMVKETNVEGSVIQLTAESV